MVLKGKINDICDKLSKLSSECKKVGIAKVYDLENLITYKKIKNKELLEIIRELGALNNRQIMLQERVNKIFITMQENEDFDNMYNLIDELDLLLYSNINNTAKGLISLRKEFTEWN